MKNYQLEAMKVIRKASIKPFVSLKEIDIVAKHLETKGAITKRELKALLKEENKMATLKQEIKALKVGQEKIFKVDYESEYITIRKSKAKGLEIIVNDGVKDYDLPYDCIANNFREFSLYDESEIDY